MQPLPTPYAWLAQEPSPKMIVEALKLFGTLESAGTANNPTIIEWAREVGGKVEDVYRADSIAWCGLFMAVVAKRAGKALPVDPLWALNWGTFGTATTQPMLGDVLTFIRRTADGHRAGHVALYIGEDAERYHILGGNQNDRVCIITKPKSSLYQARRTPYNVMPANVRKITLSGVGGITGASEG